MYATVSDVQARMPQFQLTETSKPTLDTAQVLLDDTHAQFDAAMAGLGYVIPITGTNSRAQAKEIVCQGAICKILEARGAAIGTDATFQSADRACERFQKALELLADPKSALSLSDAQLTDEYIDKISRTHPMGLYPLTPRITMDSKF